MIPPVFLRVFTILALAVIAAAVLSLQGSITFEAFETSARLPLALVLALVLVLALLWRFFGRIWRAVFNPQRRDQAALRALAKAHVAHAAGRSNDGLKSAQRASAALVGSSASALVLRAEAAESAEKWDAARDAYDALMSDPATKFLGLMGHLRLALKDGDQTAALSLADQALTMEPSSLALADQVVTLTASVGDFDHARRVIDLAQRKGAYSRNLAKRRRALINHAEAVNLSAQGTLGRADADRARDLAVDAHDLAPDMVPYAVQAAQAEARRGAVDAAQRILRTCYGLRPHPDLIACAAQLDPAHDPKTARQYVNAVIAENPHHVESRLAQAGLSLAHDDFAIAASALETVIGAKPNFGPQGAGLRASLLMAQLVRETTRGEPQARADSARWFAQAAIAPADHHWRCQVCGQDTPIWAATCARCGGLDQLIWPDLGKAAALIDHKPASRQMVASERALDDPGLEGPSAGSSGWRRWLPSWLTGTR
jgi:HemY protein